MCYNETVSLITWIIVVCISILMYKRNKANDRWNATFIITFTLIQLLEAVLWISIKHNNVHLNQIITRTVLVALWLQPLVQTYMGYITTGSNFLFILSIVLALVFTYYTIYAITSSKNFYTSPGQSCHLVWHQSKDSMTSANLSTCGNNNDTGLFLTKNKYLTILYLIGLFVPLLFMIPKWQGYVLLFVGITSFTYAKLTSSPQEFSSMWCYVAIIYAVVAYIINI